MVMGFISCSQFIIDLEGEVLLFDVLLIEEMGSVKFDFKVMLFFNNVMINWLFKVESLEGLIFVELFLMDGYVGLVDMVGVILE